MAVKKATAKGSAAATEELNPAGTTDMVQWDEQFAADAKIAAAVTISGGGDFVSFKGGGITMPNKQVVPGGKMEVVVLGHILENDYFGSTFDPDNPAPPVCFAFGDNPDTMVPHEKSTDKQSETCATCWANKYKSDPVRGKGKACKNLRRLGMIAGDEESLEDISAEKAFFAKVPVTSGKNWDEYVRDSAATLKRPPYALVTEITSMKDDKVQVVVSFKLAAKISKANHFQALKDRHEAMKELIDFPYEPKAADEEEEAPARRGPNKFAGKGKPAAKKAAARR